jgi:thiol-disulfide isomerase/thioredoxin
MKKLFGLVVGLFLTISILCSQAFEYKITGRILDCNGEPIKVAHCHVILPEGYITYSSPVDSKGRFKVSFSMERSNFVMVYFTGVNHKRDSLLVFFPKATKEINLEVKLAPYIIKENIAPTIIGNFEGSNKKQALTMESIDNGKYVKTVKFRPRNGVPKDTLRYEIGGIVPKRYINGTFQDFYIYDGDGDYMSCLVTNDTIVKIEFDPSLFPTKECESTITSSDTIINYHISIFNLLKSIRNTVTYDESLKAQQDSLISLACKHLENLSKLLSFNQPDLNTRKMILMDYLLYSTYLFRFQKADEINKNFIKEAFDVIEPTSSLWGFWSFSPGIIIGGKQLILEDSTSTDYLDSVIIYNPNFAMKKSLLSDAIDYFWGLIDNLELGRKYYDFFEKYYKDTPSYKRISSTYAYKINPAYWEKVINALLKYSFSYLEGNKTARLTDLKIKDKLVFIDFWSTSCSPCIAEFPNILETYKKLKGKIAVVLISLDKNPETVVKLLESKKMYNLDDWYYFIEKDGFNSSLVKELGLGIVGIPFPILLDLDNKKVLASDLILRGPSLENTIKGYLQK